MSKAISSTFSDEDKQALANATGEMSPNVKTGGVIDQIISIVDKFDHTHETVTDSDAILVIIQSNFGERKDGSGAALCGTENYKGCTPDLINMLSNFLTNNEDFIPIFGEALMHAYRHYALDGDTDLAMPIKGIPE